MNGCKKTKATSGEIFYLCTLETQEKQRECKFYCPSHSGWCIYISGYGAMNDECMSVDANEDAAGKR